MCLETRCTVSKAGSTQGCGIGMLQIYAVGSLPLVLEVKEDVPDVIQVLFADDNAGGGKIKRLKVWAEKMRAPTRHL